MNNLASTLHHQGDLTGARTLQEKVLEVFTRVLGEEHPDTSTSAWNLFSTLSQQNEQQAALALLQTRLLWLLERDPATLSAAHQQIRNLLTQILQQVLQPPA
jgi:hypothetical protein